MPDVLRVGDRVWWRGSWGHDPSRRATVTGLTLTDHPHEKYGLDVPSVSWSEVQADRVIVSLDNRHWAYGPQVRPSVLREDA